MIDIHVNMADLLDYPVSIVLGFEEERYQKIIVKVRVWFESDILG